MIGILLLYLKIISNASLATKTKAANNNGAKLVLKCLCLMLYSYKVLKYMRRDESGGTKKPTFLLQKCKKWAYASHNSVWLE